MSSTDIHTERAARGAALLDTVRPQWYANVETSELDMTNAAYCVLGQVYGDYQTGMSKLFPRPAGVSDNVDSRRFKQASDTHGFSAYDQGYHPLGFITRIGAPHWEALRVAWCHEIAARHDADAQRFADAADEIEAQLATLTDTTATERDLISA